jgi:hypothetical protein
LCFCPHRSGILPVAITPGKVEIYAVKKEGGWSRGCFSWVASLLCEGVGVILQAAAENKRIERKYDIHRAVFF